MIENPGIKLFRHTSTYLILTVGAIIMIFPLIWTLSTSLKPQDKVTRREIALFTDVRPQNYVDLFEVAPVVTYFQNTGLLIVVGLFGALVPSALTAYAFARIDFPGRKYLFFLLLATMMLPGVVRLIPMFVLFDRIGWVNTFWPLILPRVLGHNAFYIFLMRQFFKGIQQDLFDSAKIDGCSEIGAWARIAMPMSKPVLAAVSIFSIQFAWNEFLTPLIYLGQNKDRWTLALGLNALASVEGQEQTLHMMMSMSILMILPMLIMFFIGQKYIIQGVHIGGIKG